MPKKILVADDNRAMADVIRFNIQRAGFDVSVAASGREAWELLQTDSFDFVVTDYQMPEMSGEELCRRMREDERFVHIPVLLLSAKGLEIDSAAMQQELRLEDIIFKPFSPKHVVETIEARLSGEPARI